MLWLKVFIALVLYICFARGESLNSVFGRVTCYKYEQMNCKEDFIHVYKHLSRSAYNLSAAESHMLLFTRKNPDQPELLHKCGGKLPPDSNFDPKRKLVVLFLPFITGYCDVPVYREWTIQLFQRDDINVIVFDATWGVSADYASAIVNAKDIIRYQAVILLENIQKQTGISRKDITFIGYSLGAQIAGMVGDLFHVHRIIALDPAGPGFPENTPLEDRLDQGDADLVEVWHCNAGDCLPKFGINYDAGHVNFYINGGSKQNSCYDYSVKTLMRGDYLHGLGFFLHEDACSHGQCTVFFKVSINPDDCQFVGVKCDNDEDFKYGRCVSCGSKGENCLIMGYDTDKFVKKIPRTPQRYYVKTSMTCPYCDVNLVELQGYSATYHSSLEFSSLWKAYLKEGIGKFLSFIVPYKGDIGNLFLK